MTVPLYKHLETIAKATRLSQENQRVRVREYAEANGILVAHLPNELKTKGGITVAYRKSNDYISGIMVDISVAVCSDEDSYNRKLGAHIAVSRFLSGEKISLPLLRDTPYVHNTAESLRDTIKSTFANIE